ncbi:peptide-methionine (S)-S-oxide reductase MsrA [Photobacterium sp. SDRW27]|uniref:peptide-methionine (S)-S-oxide reductase MsrA n=1 Tax=Photobacterium obscurum TaxID=2829490 RepID=UPI002244C2B3|nr:peptide-methionine (S)-S-oxide reductase MsrA [Photobacterium obscurum]MCW8330284.1 peptide-methionine (S)-S-oxide reductase MsrA [Photobacterium obscurum]
MSVERQNNTTSDVALIGRATPYFPSQVHAVNGTLLDDNKPEGLEEIFVGMGCFWGAERLFWQQAGVYSTSVGYSGGFTPNPTYKEVCTGKTGHAEVVRVLYDPTLITLQQLLTLFWENHDPTQGMQQGNDIGTQYRSVIFTTSQAQLDMANQSKTRYQAALDQQQKPQLITTEIEPAGIFYFAEDYHQQYLAKNPDGYCALGGIGVCLPPQ